MKSLLVVHENSMLELGIKLANSCANARTVVYLYGDLGAGKTTLVRGLLRGLGYQGTVKSPTYTLVESYELPSINVFHFDFYRLRDVEELEMIGIHDYFAQIGLFLIEWPQIGKELLPPADLICHLTVKDEAREVVIEAGTERGKHVLENI